MQIIIIIVVTKIIIVISSILVILTSLITLQKPNFVDPYEKVIDVIDGDTFVIDSGKTLIRLYGLDAPDLKNCLGQDSYLRLKDLLKNEKVQLKEPTGDKYGRIVALVYVDGVLINDTLVREGLAKFIPDKSSRRDQMQASSDHARTNTLGIYSQVCTQPDPPDPACLVKGNYDMDKKQPLYFTPNCPHYNYVIVKKYEGDRWFCSVTEAVTAGFSLSPDCPLFKANN